jgi:PleD family two-component response regulator
MHFSVIAISADANLYKAKRQGRNRVAGSAPAILSQVS